MSRLSHWRVAELGWEQGQGDHKTTQHLATTCHPAPSTATAASSLAAEQWGRPSGLGQQGVTVGLPHFLSSAQVISSAVLFYCNCAQGRRAASGIFQRPAQTHNLKFLESSIEVVPWGKSSNRKNQSEGWVDAFSLRLKKQKGQVLNSTET